MLYLSSKADARVCLADSSSLLLLVCIVQQVFYQGRTAGGRATSSSLQIKIPHWSVLWKQLKKEKPLKSDLHALQLQQNLNCLMTTGPAWLLVWLSIRKVKEQSFAYSENPIWSFGKQFNSGTCSLRFVFFYWSCWRIMKATDHGLIGTGIFLGPLSTGEKVCGCRCPALPLGFVTVCQYSSTCTLQTEIHRPWDANTML